MRFTVRVDKAERTPSGGIQVTYDIGPDRSNGFNYGEHEASDFAGVRAVCEAAAREGLSRGWPGAEAVAEPYRGKRKPNGWDAHRSDRRVYLFASDVAAV